MFCASCGSEIPDNVKFCSSCGTHQSETNDNSAIQSKFSSIPEYPQESQELSDKYKTFSFDEIKVLEAKNDPVAWSEIAMRYQEGNGVEKDSEKAASLYKQSAELGYLAAIGNFGASLLKGTGIEKNEIEAINWFRLGAERGDAMCQHNLAKCFRDGSGIEQDDSKAIYWYQKAVNQNYGEALNDLGWMYDHGRGVEKDTKRALELYHSAADLGSEHSMSNIGIHYENGRGTGEDIDLANEWYLKAAEAGHVNAHFFLGNNYEWGKGFKKSWEEAKKWYEKAANLGHTEADFRANFSMLSFNKNKYLAKSNAVRFYRTSGTVLDSKRSSETHVSSSGGGGYVGRYGGTVSAPTVHSNVVTTDDFWIETENGNEEKISMTNKDISLRNGQKISLFHAIADHKKEGPYILLLNHSDGNNKTIKTSHSWWVEEQVRGSFVGLIKIILLGVIVAYGMDYYHIDGISSGRYDHIITGLSASGVYFIFKFINRIIKGKRAVKLIEEHVNSIRTWATENE